MSGFDNETVYANNWDFRGVQPVLPQVTVAGQLPIGTGGSPAILVGSLTSPLGTLLIGYSSPNVTIDLAGSGLAIDSVNVDASTLPGTSPVAPNPAGQITITGAQVAASAVGTNVIRTNSLAANTFTIEIQRSQAVAGSTIADNGVAHFNSANFTVDANGFVSLAGGGLAVDSIAVQTGTSPVVPTAAGLVTFNGAVVAAGTNPVRSDGTGANTYALEVQISQAIASTNASNIGLAAFNSAHFTVDANGFVSASGTGLGQTITGDSGGALSPTAGNWNILGRSGSKIAGAGSTLTVHSPPYADQGGSTTVALNTGSFSTAAITLTTPATAGLADGDLLEFVATNGVLVIQLAATQVGHLGPLVTSVAGTMTSTATGDSISLRYQASTNDWWATSSIGTWLMA